MPCHGQCQCLSNSIAHCCSGQNQRGTPSAHRDRRGQPRSTTGRRHHRSRRRSLQYIIVRRRPYRISRRSNGAATPDRTTQKGNGLDICTLRRVSIRQQVALKKIFFPPSRRRATSRKIDRLTKSRGTRDPVDSASAIAPLWSCAELGGHEAATVTSVARHRPLPNICEGNDRHN